MKDLIYNEIIAVAGVDVRKNISEMTTEVSVRDYLRMTAPNYTPEQVTVIKQTLFTLGLPEDVVNELLSIRITKSEEVALICNSLNFKISLKMADTVRDTLRV